ncbi:HXXEE domain-containing protein, partial [candidate division WWE3 bacterium]
RIYPQFLLLFFHRKQLIDLVYLHFFEEVISGFYLNDWIMKYISGYFQTINQAQYYGSHIVWILMIGPAALLVLGGKWTLRVLTLYGLFFVFELHHFIDAIKALSYYPGVITNIAFEIIGVFYWKELIKDWRRFNE